MTENTEQMKEHKENETVDCLTGGRAQSSANMSLKVRGCEPGVVKSVVHTIQLHMLLKLVCLIHQY